eukprot:4641514-Pyramimonas_sp.AAC.2
MLPNRRKRASPGAVPHAPGARASPISPYNVRFTRKVNFDLTAEKLTVDSRKLGRPCKKESTVRSTVRDKVDCWVDCTR